MISILAIENIVFGNRKRKIVKNLRSRLPPIRCDTVFRHLQAQANSIDQEQTAGWKVDSAQTSQTYSFWVYTVACQRSLERPVNVHYKITV